MGRLGADVDELARLARTLDRAAETLEDDRRLVARQIRGTGWDGGDARRFLSEWESSHSPVMREASQAFAAVARHVRAQADEQRKASGLGGSAPAGPGGPAGPGSPAPGTTTLSGDATAQDEDLKNSLNGWSTGSTAAGLAQDGINAIALKGSKLAEAADPFSTRTISTLSDLGPGGKIMSGMSKGFGVAGIGVGAFQVYEGIKTGDPYYAADGGVTVALSTAAMIPGVNVVGAPAAAIWGGASLINGLVSEEPLTKNIADGIGHLGDAASKVGDFLGF
ncbi:hypothetical protein AAG589_07265 [Isoptericola sp. F-RaC21]|uniref:hypothetical protein n=1 Tax=Isoptericola sp. F-RaC21 TaxID=3141452 RepID=UPI00315B981E